VEYVLHIIPICCYSCHEIALWSLEFAISVFVVACPCGIGLAAPTALLVGSGLAAKNGVLARGGGEAFQDMSQAEVMVFDKTGTLTEGKPCVTRVSLKKDHALEESILLGIAAELESSSSHPLAVAVLKYCNEKQFASQSAQDVVEHPGKGMSASFPQLGLTAILGSRPWMEENGFNVDDADSVAEYTTGGATVIYLALHGPSMSGVAATFTISDALRPEAPSVVNWLIQHGIDPWIISGDNESAALSVARQVGIQPGNVISGVLPHEKVMNAACAIIYINFRLPLCRHEKSKRYRRYPRQARGWLWP
jgi:P-type Cu+ transporter